MIPTDVQAAVHRLEQDVGLRPGIVRPMGAPADEPPQDGDIVLLLARNAKLEAMIDWPTSGTAGVGFTVKTPFDVGITVLVVWPASGPDACYPSLEAAYDAEHPQEVTR